jgi:hypothetical protein
MIDLLFKALNRDKMTLKIEAVSKIADHAQKQGVSRSAVA